MAPEPEQASVRIGWLVPACYASSLFVSAKSFRYSSVR
jgi:hypothetical protein